MLAGIEHPGLHRALGNTDDRAGLFHRLLVVVDQVDDLAVRRREFGDAGAQDRTGVERSSDASGVSPSSAISRRVLVDVIVAALAQRGQRLEAGDRQQPGGNLGTAFELTGGAPDVQKHLADEVFRHRGIAHNAQDEAVNPDVVTGIKYMHRRTAALGDALQQRFVRCRAGNGNVLGLRR